MWVNVSGLSPLSRKKFRTPPQVTQCLEGPNPLPLSNGGVPTMKGSGPNNEVKIVFS